MDYTPSSTLVSVLHTVLYLVKRHPYLKPDSAAVREFDRAVCNLLVELGAAESEAEAARKF